MKIEDNYKQVQERIAAAAARAGKSSEEIELVAVTKFANIESISKAITFGILSLGENKIQVALPKIAHFKNSPIKWHLIGHLQSNKVRPAIENFQLIHSMDSLKLAKALDKEGQKQNKLVDILIEVNVSGEGSKFGIKPAELRGLLEEISLLKNIRVQGLMTMAPFYDDPELARPLFRQLRELKNEISGAKINNINMKYLSMGMTNDFEVAIEEGANIVRIGTALFKE